MKEKERRLDIVEPFNIRRQIPGGTEYEVEEKVMITSKGGSPFSVYALKQWLFSNLKGKKHVP